jgi:hypothetical protein
MNNTDNTMKKTPNFTVQLAEKDNTNSLVPGIEAPTPDPSLPKDGDLEGWLQVFACWLLFMNTWFVPLFPHYTFFSF